MHKWTSMNLWKPLFVPNTLKCICLKSDCCNESPEAYFRPLACPDSEDLILGSFHIYDNSHPVDPDLMEDVATHAWRSMDVSKPRCTCGLRFSWVAQITEGISRTEDNISLPPFLVKKFEMGGLILTAKNQLIISNRINHELAIFLFSQHMKNFPRQRFSD